SRPVREEPEDEPYVADAYTPPPRASTPAPAPKATSSAPAPAPKPTATASSRPAPAPVAPAPSAFDAPPDVSVEETPVSDLEQYADPAKKGKLDSVGISVLEMVDVGDPQYTRSRALLLMNAQRKGDDKATKRFLDQIMLLPENQYNPVFLTDLARWHANHGDYERALEKANLAERYWARIPPELVFTKKAEIYEIQAASWQGRFYKSDEDQDMLVQAIKHWERYRQHVSTKSRADLQKRADVELAKLNDIRERLQ
ncbi:MAG: hypothetical protein ACOZNI_01925, partial [Myxococcota bacterium]